MKTIDPVKLFLYILDGILGFRIIGFRVLGGTILVRWTHIPPF
jgi:hypothetical protein